MGTLSSRHLLTAAVFLLLGGCVQPELTPVEVFNGAREQQEPMGDLDPGDLDPGDGEVPGEEIPEPGLDADEEVSEPGEPDLSWWTYQTGESFLSPTGYVEFIPGDTNVILTAPHGGYLEPEYIPNRTGTTVRDQRTQELTREYGDAFYELTGKRPHLIILLMARTKLDANRDLEVGAQGNETAEEVWYEYHGFVEEARRYAEEVFGRALYMALHGHGHPVQRVELGYMIRAADLRKSDEELNEMIDQSSLRTLGHEVADRISFAELIRGPKSFGALLEERGFPSVPSYEQPYPEETWAYFSGGYNTGRYGSRNGGMMDGIQIEANQSVRFQEEPRQAFAFGLAETTLEFLRLHYGIDFHR